MMPATPETPIGYDNPQVRFLTYCAGIYGNGVVTACSVQGPNDPNIASEISYAPNTPQATITAVTNIAVNTPSVFGGWTPIALPDSNGFRHDCITDPNAPKYPIAMLFAYIVSDPTLSYSDRQAFYALGSAWVAAAYPTQAPAILAQLQTYATNRWIPIS
jgi:hypothetical protein